MCIYIYNIKLQIYSCIWMPNLLSTFMPMKSDNPPKLYLLWRIHNPYATV